MVQTRFEEDLDLPIDDEGTLGHDRLVPDRFAGSRGPVNTTTPTRFIRAI